MTKRGLSPQLTIKITPEHWAKAKAGNSAACLIADAGRKQFPQYTGWSVDMATISCTDPERGVRFHWLTPQAAQDLLLAFDQKWAQPSHHTITLKRAFRITTVRRSGRWGTPTARAERLAELEAKEAEGKLSKADRGALTRMRRNPNPNPPAAGGLTCAAADGSAVAVGGRERGNKAARKNPNLLGGLTRAYGARRAQPAQAFRDAVEAEVAERLAQLTEARQADDVTT